MPAVKKLTWDQIQAIVSEATAEAPIVPSIREKYK